jgi:hypothetical protein
LTDSSGQILAATFDGRGQAQRAADMLSKNLGASRVELKSKRGDQQVQYAEMRDELEGVVASPVLGAAMTKSQTQGAAGGAILIGGIGLVLGVIAGFIVNGAPGSEVSVARWVMLWLFTPAVAAGTLGLLAGGMLKQRYVPAPNDAAPPHEASPDAGIEAEEETVVEIRVGDDSELQRAEGLLAELKPQRLDRFDADGEVMATKDLGNRASS